MPEIRRQYEAAEVDNSNVPRNRVIVIHNDDDGDEDDNGGGAANDVP